MRTDDLIVQLAGRLAPVKVLAAPGVRSARWLLAAAGVAAAGVGLIGLRANAANLWGTPAIGIEFGLLVVVAVVGAWATMLSAVPGAARARLARTLAVAMAVAWAAAIVARLVSGSSAPWEALVSEPADWACPARMLVTGMVPAWLAMKMVARAAPLQPVWSAVLAVLAAGAASTAAVQLMCPFDQAAHALVWHVAPMATAVAVALAWSTAARDR